MKVSLLVPSYNERDNLRELVREANDFFERHNLIENWEVIVVDDGSEDGTEEEMKELVKKFKFLKYAKHRTNLGVSESLKTGFKMSSGRVLVYFPADMQFSFEDTKRLVDYLLQNELDVVTGRKVGKYEKKFVSKIYNLLVRILFKTPATDINSIRAFRREIFEDIPLKKDWHRYIVPLAFAKGYKIGEIDVTLYPRRYGKSKYKGIGRVLVGVFDLLVVKFVIDYGEKPMLFFGTLGLITTFLGFLLGVFSIILRVFMHWGYRPLIYLVMLLLISGLVLFAIGFLGELISQQNSKIESITQKLEKLEGREKRDE